MARALTWTAFAPFLRRLRRRRGLAQARLAGLRGCHRTSIWRLERGARVPSRVLLHDLRRAVTMDSREGLRLNAFGRLHT